MGDQIEAYSLLSGESFTGHVTVIDSEEVGVGVYKILYVGSYVIV